MTGGKDSTDKSVARAEARARGARNAGTRGFGRGRGGSGGRGGGRGTPNVLVVVLESTSGTFVTPTDSAGVSPWAKQMASR